MKKKISSKKCIAVILAAIMVITSIPFMTVGAEEGTDKYDPAPYFDDAAQIEGARAWLNDEGNINVTFPEAKAQPTYKGEDLSIAFYILELVDMGPNNAAHTNTVIDTMKVTGTSATFLAADIGEINLESNRYSVTVTAVDEENWFSLPLYTTVTDVPVAEIDESRFANFSTSATAVREIMTFDQSDDDTGVVSGNALLYMGVAAEAGTEDLSDNVGDTSALRFIMNTLPSGTQTFDTSMSRQTWDFSNATEVWYWFDLTDVELQGVSFRLRANEKVWYDWGNDQNMTVTQKDYMGDIIYSTKGYTGTDGYVWVQREDGGWNKVSLTNGTVDLGNFKGYVRVPIQFICSENDSVAQLKNTGFNNGSKDFATGWNSATLTNGDSHANGIPITKMVVDAAGTNIKDARLMQHRIVATKTGIGGMGNENYWHFTNGQWVRNETEGITRGEDAMIAAGLSEAEALSDTDEGYKAIDDLYSAGFAFEGASADSLENSFFVDNIFFYDENGGPWDENAVSGMASSTGNSMATYYDEELAISKIIFDEIDKYIADPDWADYRELEYILELVEEYKAMYTAQGKDTTFLNLTRSPDTTGLAGMATKLNRDETWEKAWLAYEACATEGTIDATQANVKDMFISNAGKDELVPSIVKTMEKLPAPDSIASVSDTLRAEIVKLWQAYSLLNLGQLEMLGEAEEEKLLKYFVLIGDLEATDGDEFIVGQQLADFPYIVYNDFENVALGTKAWQIADNKNAYSTDYKSVNGVSAGTHNPDGGVYTMASGWRHTKGLTTYTTNGSVNISNEADYGYSPTDSDDDNEIMNGRLNYDAASVEVTNKGYLHSNAATMNIDSSFTTDNQDGVFHTVTLARQGKDSANWTEFQANNTNLDGLGMLSTQNVVGDTSIGLSLIFYVDFTELSSFYFTTNIYTMDDSGTPIKARPNMGIALNDQTKIDNWKYFILDPETGTWVINHTTSQWCFTSEKTDESWGDTLSLDGYKGYIMIPLYHIKIKQSATNEPKLDGNATWLNNIYAIQFCIGGKNADSLDEKSFTIDNVGFTYDPAGYPNVDNTSYADKFHAKSLVAKEFEDKVAEIDLYEDFATFKAKVDEANAMYEALPGYQKTATGQAKMLLGKYTEYAKGYKTVPEEIISPEDLSTYVQSLPTALTSSSVTGEGNDIPNPGFTSGEVNYSTVGIDKATAEQIIQYYNEGYSRFSKTQKANMANRDEFLAAYNMSMRLVQTLEGIKTEAGSYGSAAAGTAGSGFLGDLSTNLYTRKFDEDGNFVGNFVSIAGRDTVETFKEDKYDILQYYTKSTIDDGTYNANVQNISRGFTYFLNNTREFSIDGETIQGGILIFRDKLDNLYRIAYDHITNKTLFTDEEFQSIKEIIEEYNALLPAYYNVEELYDLVQQIISLFPSFDMAIGTTDIILSPDSASQQTTYSVKYAEYLDLGTETTIMYVKLKTNSEKGVLTDGAGNEMGYMLKMGEVIVNASEINGLTDDAWAATYPVANNAYTPGAPLDFVITASVTQDQIVAAQLEGTATDQVIVEFLTSDGTLIDTQTINVSYSESETYEITFPAAVSVPFAETDPVTSGDITITHNMSSTKKLTISLSENGGTMVIDTTKLPTGVTVPDPLPAINYTATFADRIITGIGTTGTDKTTFTVQVAQDQWNQAYVNDYIDSGLTFTVACEDVT